MEELAWLAGNIIGVDPEKLLPQPPQTEEQQFEMWKMWSSL